MDCEQFLILLKSYGEMAHVCIMDCEQFLILLKSYGEMAHVAHSNVIKKQ